MLRKFIFLIVITVTTNFYAFPVTKKPNTHRANEEKAVSLIRAGLEAMGGEAKIHGLSSVAFDGIGHQNAVEQSERPEGPFIVVYSQIKEIRDLQNRRLKQIVQSKQGQSADWSGFDLTVMDGTAAIKRGEREFPGSDRSN